MTLTQYLDVIAAKMGISGLKDGLLTTYLEAFAKKEGVNTAQLNGATLTAYLRAILEKRGAELPADNTLVALLSALAKSHGVATVPDNLVGTFLGAIAGDVANARKIEFSVTGDEEFTFSSTSKAVYFMHSELAGTEKANVISATCTHFTFGSGSVLAEMNDGDFIFNVSNGVLTGNVSFKNTGVLTSKAAAVEWFKAQRANGTPVVVTCYVKG